MITPNVLERNIYDPLFVDRFLLIGSCVESQYKDVFTKFRSEWGDTVSYCLERGHYNMLSSKLIDILALGKTKRVGFLTVDRSPHCVQMHFLAKYITRALKITVEFEHFVIDPSGQVFQVSPDSIDQSKQLATQGQPI